jgi:Tol biopolymer transport system component
VARPDGSDARAITKGAVASGVPSWSPDGRRILVNSGRDGNREIYVIAPDGTGLERLTNAVDGERYRP